MLAKTDPHPYDGPIHRADGVRPWNMYLWPTESWWPSHHIRVPWDVSSCHFQYIALADGRFSTDGCVYAITKNRDLYGLQCLFSSSEAAIRTSAARMIRHLLAARSWGSPAIDTERLEAVINWSLRAVAKATNQMAPADAHIPRPPTPPPYRVEAGLPLFRKARSA